MTIHLTAYGTWSYHILVMNSDNGDYLDKLARKRVFAF